MTITESIEKCKENIKKTDNKIVKLKNKLEWSKNNFEEVTKNAVNKDFYFEYVVSELEHDIKSAEKQNKENDEKLKKYIAKRAIEEKKRSYVKVPVIEDFLTEWANKTTDYYNDRRTSMKAYLQEVKEAKAKILKDNNIKETPYFNAEINKVFSENGYSDETIKNCISMLFPSFVQQHIYMSDDDWKNLLDIFINNEKEAKRQYFYLRINEKAGNIMEAKNLRIGANGEINGTIVGDKATVSVTTITAGGYNIQCLHFRVLVHII